LKAKERAASKTISDIYFSIEKWPKINVSLQQIIKIILPAANTAKDFIRESFESKKRKEDFACTKIEWEKKVDKKK
jgi:hypothetical protein